MGEGARYGVPEANLRHGQAIPRAVPLLEALRGHGIKTAIVSNTPWGSPAGAWRAELTRHGLLNKVDATVFCMDVGWRKPHRAPFERALSLLKWRPPMRSSWAMAPDGTSSVRRTPASVRFFSGQVVPKPRADCLTIPNLGDLIGLATETR